MGMFGFFSGGPKTIYVRGVNESNECFDNYKEIFKILKIKCDFLEEDFKSGYEKLMIGNRKKARNLARKNFEKFKESSVERIIISDSALFYILKEHYPKLVLNFDIEIVHVSSIILGALEKGKIKFNGNEREDFCYHDPCYLGRHFGIFDSPRKVIEILGGNIIEIKNNREKTNCCGAGGCLNKNFPKLSIEIAKKRVSEVPGENLKIISPCSLCINNLRRVKEDSIEWSGFILGRLRGMKL